MLFASNRAGRVIDKPVATTSDLPPLVLCGYATNKAQFWQADHFSDMRVFSETSRGLRISIAESLSAGLSVGPENKSQRKSAAKPSLAQIFERDRGSSHASLLRLA